MSTSVLATSLDSFAFPAPRAGIMVPVGLSGRPVSMPQVERPVVAQARPARVQASKARTATTRRVRRQAQTADGVSFRRKCVDVVLVGMWAGLIPGFMWLGHYAGF